MAFDKKIQEFDHFYIYFEFVFGFQKSKLSGEAISLSISQPPQVQNTTAAATGSENNM